MAETKREQLLQTASRLFYENGFHATGISEILNKSGVAKGTLYQHFASKDELIEAVLRRAGEEMRTCFVELVEKKTASPKDRLLSIFAVQDELWWGDDGYCGCPFTKATGEFGDREHPIHRAASLHKRLLTGYLRDLADQAGAKNPNDLAHQLAILLEGAAILHCAASHQEVTRHAAEAGRVLVEAAL